MPTSSNPIPVRVATWPPAFLLLSLAVACGDTPRVVPDRTFDRPTDMAFVCMQVVPRGDKEVVTGRPPWVCNPPESADPAQVRSDAPRTLGTFGIITNTARGEVGAIDFGTNSIVDLDPATPGFSMIPVGALPEAIATSTDGCLALTANRGSCDLTLLETSRMLDVAFDAELRDVQPVIDQANGTGGVARRIAVRTRSGAIAAAPGEVAFLPQDLGAPPTSAMPAATPPDVCEDQALDGGSRVPWRALVTYPACGLVALVALPSGQLLDSMRVTAAGLVPAGDDPVCAAACGATMAVDTAVVDAAAGDGGTSDGGASGGDAVIRVSPLALRPDGSRVYVGAENAPFVAAIDVVDKTRLAVPGQGGIVPLAEGATGSRRLRLSVDPNAATEPGHAGAFVGTGGRYLYAFALDGSVRVINVKEKDAEAECDVNVDTAIVTQSAATVTNECWPVNPATRSLFARGPGIRPPKSAFGERLPQDLSFATLGNRRGGMTTQLSPLEGAFGFMLLSTGQVIVLNVQSNRQEIQATTPPNPPPPNTFRNNLLGVAQANNNIGPLRVVGEPASTLTTNGIPNGTRGQLPSQLVPRIEGVPKAQLPQAPADIPSNLVYTVAPRPLLTAGDSYSLQWEGLLPDGFRLSGSFTQPPPGVNASGLLSDPGANFCAIGAMPGDVVQIVGCRTDEDCGATERLECMRLTPVGPGLCVERGQAETLAAGCPGLLQSRRRYEVLASTPQGLLLGPRIDELVRPSILACRQDSDCQPDAAHAGFVCAPVAPGGPGRCVRPCTATSDCRGGFVCQSLGTGSLCVEAPPIDAGAQACLAASRSYSVGAGRAFVLSSQATPAFATAAPGPDGRCQPLTARDPRLLNRIPIATAPRCAGDLGSTAAALSLSPIDRGGNPCLFVAPNADEPDRVGIECDTPPGANTCHVKALFEDASLRLVLTNLEQPFGDGVDVSFSTEGGYGALAAVPPTGVEAALPIRLLTSPMEVVPEDPSGDVLVNYVYLYLVDAGRLGQFGYRGQVLRLDTRKQRDQTNEINFSRFLDFQIQ